MDFFDPQKQRRHSIRLVVGYAILGVILALATTILLYYVRGFGLDSQGRIIRNGLVFVSSQPEGGEIYLNGKKHKAKTNARLNLPAGQYVMEFRREGYHSWKRVLTVEGGSVHRFDYPLLIPAELAASEVNSYSKAPLLSTASPDRRWLLVGTEQNDIDLYDLNADDPVPRTLEVPEDILAAGSTTKRWQKVEWARDNRHILLKRSYESPSQDGSEYILFDREAPEESQNLSVAFGFDPDKIELRAAAYDRYYLHDLSNGQLFTATLDNPTPQPYISGVLDFTTEDDIVSYVTTEGAPEKTAFVRIQKGDGEPQTVREISVGAYRLDMAVYDGVLYLAAGTAGDNRVFVYDNPLGRLGSGSSVPLVPLHILKTKNPRQISFSPNGRFVLSENGSNFAVYDAETDRGYAYDTGLKLDKPQNASTWLDGFRLTYVSGGQNVIFDFDGTNLRELSTANPKYLPAIDRDNRYLYVIDSKSALTRTALRVQEDM